jgi:diadenosine tetraphosphate (Ap4A) HIT family hydrolase
LHLHVHVIPRYSGQKLLRMEEIPEVSKEKLDKIAKMMRQHF